MVSCFSMPVQGVSKGNYMGLCMKGWLYRRLKLRIQQRTLLIFGSELLTMNWFVITWVLPLT